MHIIPAFALLHELEMEAVRMKPMSSSVLQYIQIFQRNQILLIQFLITLFLLKIPFIKNKLNDLKKKNNN